MPPSLQLIADSRTTLTMHANSKSPNHAYNAHELGITDQCSIVPCIHFESDKGRIRRQGREETGDTAVVCRLEPRAKIMPMRSLFSLSDDSMHSCLLHLFSTCPPACEVCFSGCYPPCRSVSCTALYPTKETIVHNLPEDHLCRLAGRDDHLAFELEGFSHAELSHTADIAKLHIWGNQP